VSGVAVFLGPSLPRDQAAAVLDADYLPPVRQGDVYRLVRDRRPAVIGIIDGYFHQAPSVWHKEILWALDQGVHVAGAASMGALRAAELHVFGMRGVGRIFEAFRDGVLDADDEVAVVHAPAELGFLPVSEALVDIRATVDAAIMAGVLRPADGLALIDRAKALFYADRSWDALLEPAGGQTGEFAEWLPGNRVAQKRLDALALLESLRDLPAQPFRPSFRFEPTLVWERFRAAADAEPPDSPDDGPEAAALAALRLDPAEYLSLAAQATQRLCALAEAARLELQPDRSAIRAQLDELRRDAGLARQSDLAAWAAANRLDEQGLAHLLADQAKLARLARHLTPALDQPIADLLRLRGDFPALAAHGTALSRQPAPAHPLSEFERARLAVWYFEERLGMGIPVSLVDVALRLGYSDEAAFFDALAREYRHVSDSAPKDFEPDRHPVSPIPPKP
jgi:AraC-like DNA-binding protein